jgi:hypothetical protein
LRLKEREKEARANRRNFADTQRLVTEIETLKAVLQLMHVQVTKRVNPNRNDR